MPVSPIVTRKLFALRRRIHSALQRVSAGSLTYWFNREDTLELFERWAKIRDELIATDEELADLPVRPAPTPRRRARDEELTVHRDDLERLWRDTEDAWDVMTHSSRQVAQVSLDREGIFVAGQPFDAMTAVTSILRPAKQSIVVIDGYVSDRTLDLLTVKDNAVTARVLTRTNSNTPTFRQHATAFQSQYGNLEIKTTSHFHDRFLIVDDADFFHFGTSIKDAAIRNTFMFSRIEEPAVISTLRAEFGRVWASAPNVPF